MGANADKLRKKLAQFKAEIPKLIDIMGVEAKNFAVKSFTDQGWTDEIFNAWSPRKRNSGAYRAILIKSGDLRRSIRIVGRTSRSITIGSNSTYGRYHNEGTSRMVKRQFMGDSAQLKRIIRLKLHNRLKYIINN
jgi:phage gpG-like protein